jgi:hypothetical protein
MTKQQTAKKDAPVHEHRLGRILGVVWKNRDDQGRAFYSVQLSRLFRDDRGSWQRSTSFGRDDLLVACKVLDQLHTWIYEAAGEQEDNDSASSPANGEAAEAPAAA